MLSKDNLRIAARRYLAGVIVYGLGLWLYTHNGYYKTLLLPETLTLLKALFVVYLATGLPMLVIEGKRGLEVHKPVEILKSFGEMLKVFKSFSYSFLPGKKRLVYKLDTKYKVVLRFMLVKVFYIPLMLNFFFSNYRASISTIKNWSMAGRIDFIFREDYITLFSFIFLLDTAIFAFGYLVEHKWLDNKVKSVEPTMLGWVVALASYPPFNDVSGRYFSWYSHEYFFLPNALTDTILKVLMLTLLLLYLWATFSLGAKASNLTNRGIVTDGAYRWIRHPAYTGKVLAWWIMAVPVMSLPAVGSLLAWTGIYYMRAITEERHLIKDKDYRKYVKKTKYRFVPGIV